jgi:hypothetical protein
VHAWEHLAMTLDHGQDDVLPKLSELCVRHLKGGLQFVDGCIPPVLGQDRQVPAHLSDCHRTVHLVYRPVGLVKQRLGIRCDCVTNGSHWATPFSANLP